MSSLGWPSIGNIMRLFLPMDSAGNMDPLVQTIPIMLANAAYRPRAPTVYPVTSPTSIRRQIVRGTKEAGTDVRLE